MHPEASFIPPSKPDMLTLIKQYVTMLETEETDRLCSCLWRIHPEDLNKEEGKRRKVKVEENETCPVHTKEGYLLGFINWLSMPTVKQLELFPAYAPMLTIPAEIMAMDAEEHLNAGD